MYQQKSIVAYSPTTPPLTAAARVQIVAALCERQKKRQTQYAAANKAANAQWKKELYEISIQPPKKLSVPQLISLPSPPISTAIIHISVATEPSLIVTETALPTTTAPAEPEPVTSTAIVSGSTTVEHTEMKNESDVEEVVTSASSSVLEENKPVVKESKEESECESVERPILFDVGSLLHGEEKENEEKSTEKQSQTKENNTNEFVPGTDPEAARPMPFDTSSVKPTDVMPKEEANTLAFQQQEPQGEGEEILPGAESGVVRPLLFNGIGKLVQSLHSTLVQRAKKDIKKLRKDVPLTGAGASSVVGAITTIVSMKNE